LAGANAPWSVPIGILCSIIGCVAIYAALFSIGYFLYGQFPAGIVLLIVAILGGLFLLRTWAKVKSL